MRMKIHLSVAAIVLAVTALAMPAYGDEGDWTGPGYYIADSGTGIVNGFIGGPYASEAECKAALARMSSEDQADSSCDFYATDPFKSGN